MFSAVLEGVHTTGGLSNLSYGLLQRRIINRCFLAMMIGCGFDSAIMDPPGQGHYGHDNHG